MRSTTPGRLSLVLVTGWLTMGPTSPVSAQTFTTEPLRFGLSDRTDAGIFADVDGDGHDDFVYCVDQRIQILYRERNPTPRREFRGSVPANEILDPYRAIAVGDFDNDGRQDIATGSRNSDITILWQNDFRRFEVEVIDAGRGAMFLQAVDIDRDGTTDLLCADRHESQEVLWYGGTRGAMIAHPIATLQFPYAVAAGNLDEDEGLEVVASTWTGVFLIDWEISEENPDGGYSEPVPLREENGTHLIMEDLDGDRRLDLAFNLREIGEEEITKVLWLRNMGDLKFAETELTSSVGSYFRWIQPADLDGDGDSDLVVGRWVGSPRFHFYLNDGRGSFTEKSLSLEGDTGRGLYSFSVWNLPDGRSRIIPHTPVFAQDASGLWQRLVLERDDLKLNVYPDGDSIAVSWFSNYEWNYSLQFSSNLEDWSDSYLSGGAPVTVEQIGTGLEMVETLAPPDTDELYVRVVAEKPAE